MSSSCNKKSQMRKICRTGREIAIQNLRVDIPEADYPKLSPLNNIVAYLHDHN